MTNLSKKLQEQLNQQKELVKSLQGGGVSVTTTTETTNPSEKTDAQPSSLETDGK